LEAPAYGPRSPRATVLDPFAAYLRERVPIIAEGNDHRATPTGKVEVIFAMV